MTAFFASPIVRGLGLLLAIVGIIWWIDSRGYERAVAERDLLDANARLEWDSRVNDLEERLIERLGDLDARLAARIDAIDTIERTIVNPTIEREIVREARYSDPAAGISDQLRGAINAARAATACDPGVDGGAPCALPAAPPAG